MDYILLYTIGMNEMARTFKAGGSDQESEVIKCGVIILMVEALRRQNVVGRFPSMAALIPHLF